MEAGPQSGPFRPPSTASARLLGAERGALHRAVVIGLIGLALGEFFGRSFLPGGYGRAATGDEVVFRPTWMLLTDTSMGLAERLDGYAVLTTPLPMVFFGVAERLGGALWAPRLVATAAALVVLAVVCWRRVDTFTSLQIGAGVLLVPHFLRTATVAYTDPLALVCVVVGLVAHSRRRHGSAALWFALGIACRQFVVAFPLAVIVWEILAVGRAPLTRERMRVLGGYGLACATLIGWFLLFGGLTPAAADGGPVPIPDVQQSLFTLDPEAGLFFLSAVGLFFVIPEVVISPSTSVLARRWSQPVLAVLFAVFVASVVFPFNPDSAMYGFHRFGLSDPTEFVLYLALAMLAAVRFAERSLPAVIVWIHGAMLMKSYPWSKYALLAVVALWLLHGLPASRRAGELGSPTAAAIAGAPA